MIHDQQKKIVIKTKTEASSCDSTSVSWLLA